MVFAANLPVRVFGTGAGEARLTFAGQTKTVASAGGKWLVEFPPIGYGGPYELIFEDENERVVLQDIYVGEVYLFAGQSNMELQMKFSSADASAYESCEMLRMFTTDGMEQTSFYDAKDGWVKCKKEEVGEWSALAYHSALEIAKTRNVPVGIIMCYQGASVIESWVPEGAFEENGIHIPLEKKHVDHTDRRYPWNKDGALYSLSFLQAAPFSVSAVIWYQGESDTALAEAKVYKQELLVLIDIWRKDLRNPELPFVIIQIADYVNRKDEAWKTIQKAQEEVLQMRHDVKGVRSSDVCEKDTIHPPTKAQLAKRVAQTLMKESGQPYGKD